MKYLVESHHILYPILFVVNKELYESMPPEVQAQFNEAAAEAKEFAVNLMKESSETDKQKMIAAGMTEIILSDEELAKMRDAGLPVVEKLVRDSLGDSVVDAFMNSLK